MIERMRAESHHTALHRGRKVPTPSEKLADASKSDTE
jgi:hypothetical protein